MSFDNPINMNRAPEPADKDEGGGDPRRWEGKPLSEPVKALIEIRDKNQGAFFSKLKEAEEILKGKGEQVETLAQLEPLVNELVEISSTYQDQVKEFGDKYATEIETAYDVSSWYFKEMVTVGSVTEKLFSLWYDSPTSGNKSYTLKYDMQKTISSAYKRYNEMYNQSGEIDRVRDIFWKLGSEQAQKEL